MKKVLAALAALSLMSACNTLNGPSPTAAKEPYDFAKVKAAQEAAASSGDKVICREDLPTGSKLPIRTCHTKSEWAALDDADLHGTKQFNDKMNTEPNFGRQN